MLTWILLVVPVILIYFYLKHVKQYWVKLKVPLFKPWLLFGDFGPFLILRKQSFADFIQNAYNSSKDSRYIGLYFFTSPFLLLKDLDLVKQIAIKDFDFFADHVQQIDPKVDPLFAKNLFMLRGDKWRSMRSTLSPAFTGSKMRAMFVLISDCAEQFSNYFTKSIKPNETLTLELKDTFTRFANDVIATTAFGITCNSVEDKENEFYLMGKELTNMKGLKMLKFFIHQILPPLAKILKLTIFAKKTVNFFSDIIKSNIRSREEKGIYRPDVIHLLLEARKGKLRHEEKAQDEGAGFATVEESHIGKQTRIKQEILSDDDIFAQAFIFFFAGFETISTVLCHTVYELAINVDIQEKLQKEIDETLKECKGKINYESILKMKYLDMVVCEGLRKWPTLPEIDRCCTNNYTIKPQRPNEVPIHLKKDEAFWIPIYGFHRDPKYFPNPDKFDPERFNEENKTKIVPFSYLPFGIGPRNCIGSRFALLEIKTLFFHMLSKLSFVLVEKSEIPITIAKGEFSMHAANGFWVGLKRRTNN